MSDASRTRRPAGGIPPADWDLLFDAVAWRLRCSACAPAAVSVRAAIEDSVHALDLLRAALALERGQLRRVETQLHETCATLAALQAGEYRARHLAPRDRLTPLPNHSLLRSLTTP